MIQNIGMESGSAIADQDVRAVLSRLSNDRFFGTVEVVFESGRIVRLKKHEILLQENVKEFIEA
ncbi:MAG: hypothetical protein KCHDKBKB_02799 [Elusimicrobia bacterium]|nr:hypothetical protein [Elusimicrobiota bacterium]